MGSMMRGRLYRLAKRLSIGRVLRYLDLWARYLWRRSLSRLGGGSGHLAPGTDAGAQAAALADADMATAKRMAVASWFPLDLADARLHRAMLASVAEARPDLGITPDILDCVARLKNASDLSVAVDGLVASGETPQTINTALYLLLLRRPPDPSELRMIRSRHPRHALIAIQSGDQYRTQGRRTLVS
jgi:hypothetical protein